MGELADDIIEGACCSQCMDYFDNTTGYPRFCKSCAKELRAEGHEMTLDHQGGYIEVPTPTEKFTGWVGILRATRGKVVCPTCGKRVGEQGLAEHNKAKHAALAVGRE